MKKFKILLIIMVLFIICGSVVLAKTGITTTNSVNLRNKPSTDSDVIKSLSKDESLEILEESREFYKVLYKGRVGYVSKKFVNVSGESTNSTSAEATNTTNSTSTTTENPNVKNETVNEASTTSNSTDSDLSVGNYKLNNDADVYVLPVLYALKNGNLKKGDNVNVITVISNWVYISNGNMSGWIFRPLIDGNAKTVESTSNAGADKVSSDGNFVTVNTDAVNIREKPSISSDVLGSVGKGRKLEVIGKSGDWTQVKFNNVKGYILSKFVL